MTKLLVLSPLKISNSTTNRILQEAGEDSAEVITITTKVVVELIKVKVMATTATKAEVEPTLPTREVVEMVTKTTETSTKVTLTMNVKQLLRMVIKTFSM